MQIQRKQVQTQAEVRFISSTDIVERLIRHDSVITDGLEGLQSHPKLLP